MSRWIQLDRMYLRKRGFFYKIPLLILVVTTLVIGYHHVTGKPTLRDVIERQFSQIDDLKESFENYFSSALSKLCARKWDLYSEGENGAADSDL